MINLLPRCYSSRIPILISILLLSLISHLTFAAQIARPNCAPVLLYGEDITCIKERLGAFSPSERAELIVRRIDGLAHDFKFNTESISTINAEGNIQINASDLVIASFRDTDIEIPEKSTLSIEVQKVAERMRIAINQFRERRAPHAIAIGALKTFGSTLVLILILWILGRLFPIFQSRVQESEGRWIKNVSVKGFELLHASRIVSGLSGILSFARFVLTLMALYIYVPLIFSFFPWTSGWSAKLYGYISYPLHKIVSTTVDLIPNFFFLGIIFFLTRYILRIIRFFFEEVERERVKLEGFYTEWAQPTYKLVRVFVIAFAFVMAFPYIPGSSSPAFQGISVFLGLLLSLGSSSAIGNMVAGIVITYMRPFKLGDRVQIADTVGDVIEKNLLVTRIKTIKNVDITIPNAVVLAGHITNFSAHAHSEGLILHTSVTIGYDTPWVKIHKLLIGAALKTEGIDCSKQPFVLQTALSDFYVEYQINAFTTLPQEMATVASRLHQNIQDEFSEADVEIMSPHYASLRDGSDSTVPGTSKK